MSEFVRQSESHLLEITRTYWALYAARVTYLQKAKLVDETGRVADELKRPPAGRCPAVPALPRRNPRSPRAARDLIRSEAAVRNAQDRLAR